jgi:hypothetical protein
MIYASTREAKVPGFDAWYWALCALLPKAGKVLLIAGAYDSDGTIQEFLGEACRRGKPVTIHFVERGPLAKTFELNLASQASVLEDLDSFAEREAIPLDDGDETLRFDF